MEVARDDNDKLHPLGTVVENLSIVGTHILASWDSHLPKRILFAAAGRALRLSLTPLPDVQIFQAGPAGPGRTHGLLCKVFPKSQVSHPPNPPHPISFPTIPNPPLPTHPLPFPSTTPQPHYIALKPPSPSLTSTSLFSTLTTCAADGPRSISLSSFCRDSSEPWASPWTYLLPK